MALALGAATLVVGAASPRAAAMSGRTAAARPPRTLDTVDAAQSGYRLLGGDGGVFSFSLPFYGSAASDPTLCAPDTTDREMPEGTCWSLADVPGGGGYWILNASTGVISAFGGAVFYGDPAQRDAGAGRELLPTFIDIVASPDGAGYWVLDVGLSGTGTVEGFGSAAFFGDEATLVGGTASGHVGHPVAMASTASGAGYWIVDSDGGVFSFGDAAFYGSMGATHLAAPVVGIAADPAGAGYWLVGADGGVFAFGDASFGGSMAGTVLAATVVGIAADPAGAGYWLVGADGGVFALGGAPFLGSMAGTRLHRPVFAVAA